MRKLTLEQKLIKLGEYNPREWLANMYKKGKSCNEIAELLKDDHNITITARALSDKIRQITPIRTRQEAKQNAIKRGRMVYLKKPESEKYKQKGISALLRSEVLRRDDYKCIKCGNSPKTGYSIELHHRDCNPQNNTFDNLDTLCFLCHRGLHALKKEQK